MEETAWRRTLAVLVVVHLVTSVAFNLGLPFLPLYVKELRILTGGSHLFWSGFIFTIPALAMMVAMPFWGWVADRYGRKIMLIRSTVAGAVILALMGVVTTVEELAVLRLCQGLFTGYIAAANALVAATIPKPRMGASFGIMRTAAWMGTGLGPLIGGVVADAIGFRGSFFVTAILLAMGGILVLFLVREVFEPQPSDRQGIFAAYGFLLRTPGLRRIYGLSFLDAAARSVTLPVLPLFMLALLGSAERVSTMTGLAIGLRATVAALAAYAVGRLGDRIGHGRLVFFSALLLCGISLPQALAGAPWQLIALQLLFGLLGVGMVPGIGALLGLHQPQGASGKTFGLDASIQSLGRVVGPMAGAGVAAFFGLAWAFVLVAALYVVAAVLAWPLRGDRRDPTLA